MTTLLKRAAKSLLLLIFLMPTVLVSAKKPVVAVLGDSYSTFEGGVWPDKNELWYFKQIPDGRTDVDGVEQTWWSLLTAPESPYELGVNNSYSGATISFTGYDGADYSDRSFISRMYGLGNPDIILVFGATNDSWAGAPIGEYKDSGFTHEDLKSFRPALSCLLQNLKELYPQAQIYFLLNDSLRDEIDESALAICRQQEIEVIELDAIDKHYGHPTRKGMQQIASAVRSRLDARNSQ